MIRIIEHIFQNLRFRIILFLFRLDQNQTNVETELAQKLTRCFGSGADKQDTILEQSFRNIIKKIESLPPENSEFEKQQLVALINRIEREPHFLTSLPYRNIDSFSQEGEDLFLNELFAKDYVGFYVDVGAHHPFRFSNTARLSLHGWKGINIDPVNGLVKLFQTYRPQDITLELGISVENKDLPYFQFDEPALNTFSQERASYLQKNTDYRLVTQGEIHLRRLADVLVENMPKNQKIDLLCIDVEDLEISILRSNDWKQFRPKVILIELLQNAQVSLRDNESLRFLENLGYEVKYNTIRNYIFMDKLN